MAASSYLKTRNHMVPSKSLFVQTSPIRDLPIKKFKDKWHRLSQQNIKSTQLYSPGPDSYFLPSPWE